MRMYGIYYVDTDYTRTRSRPDSVQFVRPEIIYGKQEEKKGEKSRVRSCIMLSSKTGLFTIISSLYRIVTIITHNGVHSLHK